MVDERSGSGLEKVNTIEADSGQEPFAGAFVQAMDAMKAAGGKIYYFVMDFDSRNPHWDKVLYFFKRSFEKNDSQLLILDVPDGFMNRPDFQGVNAIADRYCTECQGIIKVVNTEGAGSLLLHHTDVYIAKEQAITDPFAVMAAASDIKVQTVNEWLLGFVDEGIEDTRPLLSICIPTFNRARFLKLTLDSIIGQSEFAQGLVEIVISDNCSTDDTEKIGRLYDDTYSMIRYFRNDENVAGKNFNLVLCRATGILRKLNNDTCLNDPDSLSYMCRMAKKYMYMRPAMYFGNNPFDAGDNDHLLLMRPFLLRESFHITWIASFAAWAEDCEGIEDEFQQGEFLWQVRKIIELINKRKAVAACDKAVMNGVVTKKNYSASWLWQVFHDDYFSIIDKYITEDDKAYIEKDLLYHHFESIRKMSETYPDDMKIDEDYDKTIALHYQDKPYWNDYCESYKSWHDKTFAER